MPQPLTSGERKIARAYARLENLSDKAKAAYARVDRATAELAGQVFKLKRARAINDFTRAVRISEDGKHLLVKAQFLAAQHDAAAGGEGKLWGHAAVRPWDLSTKNLD
jgi:hypothetical protein